MSRWKFFGSAALSVIALDQLSKQWMLSFLDGRSCGQTNSCTELVAGVRLRLLFNDGAAFSTGEGLGRLFAIGAILVTAILIYLASQRAQARPQIVLGILAGGAVGNLLDRVFRAGEEGWFQGGVVDFIDLGWWPVFNVADVAIVLGAALAIFKGIDDDSGEQNLAADSDSSVGLDSSSSELSRQETHGSTS